MSDHTTTDAQFKTCTKCGQTLPATPEYFHRRGNGLRPVCKMCRSQTRRKHYLDNREHTLAVNRKWALAHPEQCAAIQKKYQTQNRDKRTELHRNWIKNNPERARELDNQSKARRRNKNPEQFREKQRVRQERWIKNNLERRRMIARAAGQRRRALERNADGSHTVNDIQSLYQESNGRCWWCGKDTNGNYHIDHRVPLSKGGSDSVRNLCISCPDCNRKKNDRLPYEFNGRLL
jgi:hypothetical protein